MKFKKKFIKKDGIYQFEISENVTKKVTDFYFEKPFPNYKKQDDKFSILNLGNKNYIAKKFKDFIGFNKDILEVGSGTGQLSNFLATGTNNRIYALDPTITSIKLGKEFADINNITNIAFLNGDIFDDIFNDESFDHIWCNGVLHHTKDPYLAFQHVAKSLKTNGYILLGLYNKYGRLRTFIRRFFFKFFGRPFIMIFDPILRSTSSVETDKIESWINDQYMHPVESSHTFDEILTWFKKNNIEFINSIPSSDFDINDEIFKKKSYGSFFTRIVNQISMIFSSLGGDGGLFIFIGKKNIK